MTALLIPMVLAQTARWFTDWNGLILPLLAIAVATLLIAKLMRGRTAKPHRSAENGLLTRSIEAGLRAFSANWQLTLLASTALVLSLASGWTTWDGMRNFTGEPVLSLMITFGVQGVMLIIAWIIGESFATGMTSRTRNSAGDWTRSSHRQKTAAVLGLLVGTLFAAVLFLAIAKSFGLLEGVTSALSQGLGWAQLADKALWLVVGLLLIGAILANRRSDIAQPYLQSARIVARNAVLWVMFLACMATSVFFSFDSLFSSIFPADERKRAAEIRSINQVAGIVSDIGALLHRRQGEEIEALFRSEGWARTDTTLADLARASQGAEEAIESFVVEQMEARRRAVAQQQERIATAFASQAGLSSKKTVLTDELSRLRGERPELAADFAKVRSELDDRVRSLDGKRIEAQAEEKGAEGTLKTGRGPQWRERMGELARQQEAIKIQEERVRDAHKRVTSIDQRIAQIDRELASIDGDIAKLKGEAQTAETRIAAAAQSTDDASGPKGDPARVRAAFERARADFRLEPTTDRLAAVTAHCAQLHSAMASTPATQDRVRDITCDAKQAVDAAARVFALNASLDTFARQCVGGDKLPQTGGTDAMLGFGRRCLQDSGLASRDAGEIAAKLSAIDLSRDDKAHRFVVTWNAFQDGNRLAYLALAIAIAIDSLVFMSGLFGANAVRSPLTDLDGRTDLTADQLEAVIDQTLANTLHPRATLAALSQALRPVENAPASDGFTSHISIDDRSPLAAEMRAVLAAGGTIGAVRKGSGEGETYLVSVGLARYFPIAQKKSWTVDTAEIDRKELITVVGVALLPDPQGNAEQVLADLHPISDVKGYAAQTRPDRIADATRQRLLRRVLGAGATVAGAVQSIEGENARYLVSTDFYKTLLLMSAGAFPAHVSDPEKIAEQQTRRAAVTRALVGEDVPAKRIAPSLAERLSLAAPSPRDDRPSPAARAVDDELQRRNDIRDELTALGDLPEWDERDVAVARRLGEAAHPKAALERLAKRAPRLAQTLARKVDECRASVHAATERLRARHPYDPATVQVLKAVADELTHLMPLLVLSPGGPYQQILEDMIADLEPQDGEGALSPADQSLLKRTKEQVAALQRLSNDDSDRLRRVAEILDDTEERGPPGATNTRLEKRILN